MDIVLHRAGTAWADPLQQAMVRGLAAHGHACEIRSVGDWRECDVAIVWGGRHTDLFALQAARRERYGSPSPGGFGGTGSPSPGGFGGTGRVLVMERGYVGERREWTSLGFDGLNGHAVFPVIADGGARWDQLFGGLLKDRDPVQDGYTLLAGQLIGDASLIGADHGAWLRDSFAALRNAGRDVVFRPHPRSFERSGGNWRAEYGDYPHAFTGPLDAALAGARVAVTWNSNLGVDATLAGVPVVAMDRGSMAWDVAGHDLLDIVTPDPAARAAWAHRLAWRQWARSEIERGAAWEALVTCL